MERRRLADDLYALVSTDLEQRGFLAVCTERAGGASEGPYASLDLALHTGDAPEAVAENRDRVAGALGTGAPVVPEQVHGARLVRVGGSRAGAGWASPDPVPAADGLLATRPGLPLAILTADCLPVALASPAEGLVAAVHAGWRGLAAGILEQAVARFHRPGGLRAAIGPAIGPCHYEVGEDVALAVAAGSDAGAVTERRDGRLYLDLPGTAARVLRRAGVRHLDRAEECTACEAARFFSHRRDGVTGRQVMVAMRM